MHLGMHTKLEVDATEKAGIRFVGHRIYTTHSNEFSMLTTDGNRGMFEARVERDKLTLHHQTKIQSQISYFSYAHVHTLNADCTNENAFTQKKKRTAQRNESMEEAKQRRSIDGKMNAVNAMTTTKSNRKYDENTEKNNKN